MDGSTLGAAIALIKKNKPTDEQIESAVSDWLDDHPEATTTVQDGSITKAKLDSNLQGTVDDVSDLKVALAKSGGGGGGAVDDVKVNGVSVVSGGVANIPVGGSSLGVVKFDTTGSKGIKLDNSNDLIVDSATNSEIRASYGNRPIIPTIQNRAVFYGLAKAAGDDTQKNDASYTGVYTETAKSKISDMLNAPETVSGTTPSITAKPGVRYICGECTTLDITVPSSGCIDVTFESGSTPTVLTITPPTGMTMKWANGFDPTSLDANTTYEINILDGCYGVVGQWT